MAVHTPGEDWTSGYENRTRGLLEAGRKGARIGLEEFQDLRYLSIETR
jgi:hypothetical protein